MVAGITSALTIPALLTKIRALAELSPMLTR